MEEHINERIQPAFENLKAILNEKAEIYAEEYVSSVLGLTDEDESKEGFKKEYVAWFIDKLQIIKN